MGERIRRAELARRLSVSRQRVHQLVQSGQIVVGDDGLVDFESAKAQYLANTDVGKRSRASQIADEVSEVVGLPTPEPEMPGPLGEFNRAKTAREFANAELAKHKLAVARGDVVSREEVQRQQFEVGQMIRDRILGWPGKLANFLPPESMKQVEAEAKELIGDLQSEIARRFGHDDDAAVS